MDLWVIWILLACVLAAGEIATVGFFLAPFSAGAFLAAAVAAAGLPDPVSVLVFLVASGLCFAFLRPIARRHTRMPPLARTGVHALIGQTALALEPIDEDHGSIKLAGEVWTARSYLDDHRIPAGARVDVVEIKGATALVTE